MSHPLPPLALLRTFEAAGRHLSFKKAAAELHVTPAAVSQQIKALEAHLGGALFQRLTRALRLSDRGARMLPKVRAGLDCLSDAVAEPRPGQAGAVLRVTAPPSLASHWLVPRLPSFYAAHPDIELRLSSSSDTVDHDGNAAALAALELAPGNERSELAIVYGTGHYARYHVDALLTPDYVPVCAPGLGLADHALRTPAGLCQQVLIHDDTLRHEGGSGAPAWGWDQWLRAAGVVCPGAGPGRHFSNAVLALEAALAGQGVALAARPLVAGHIAAGTLIQPFDLSIPSPFSYFLVSLESTAQRPEVAAFRHWLLTQAHPST
jgi:LysR family glycine cleavage system transcriptional activator